MKAQTIRSDSPSYETVDGRKYTACNVCEDVIDLTPEGQFTFNTVVYGNGFAIRAYCSLACLDRMIRPAIKISAEQIWSEVVTNNPNMA